MGRRLSKQQLKRLEKLNLHLYPARLRILPSGAFQIDWRSNGKNIRKVLSEDMEIAYERALIMVKEDPSVPFVSERDISFGQWYQELKPKREKSLAPSTWEIEQFYWRAISNELKNAPLSKMKREQIVEFLDSVDKPSQRDHISMFISTLLNAAVKSGMIQKSPYKHKRQKRQKDVTIIATSKLPELLDSVSETARPAAALAVFCGLRRGEIMALKIKDIDFNRKVVKVSKSRSILSNGEDVIKSTKTGKIRSVPIVEQAISYIEPATIGKDPDDLLYPVFRKDLHKRIQNACKTIGVPEITFHDLRHNCATHLMEIGGLALAQAVLGHSNITTTADTYGHLESVYLANQMNRVGIKLLAEQALGLCKRLESRKDEDVSRLVSLTEQICRYLSV